MGSEKIIVLVSDKEDSKHGEISVLDDPQKAERLVETLLEAGFDAGRIKVFTGRTSDFQVSQRPVVALVADDEQNGPRASTDIASREATVEPPADAEAVKSDTEEADKAETEEELAAPVRFSSLFRSA